MQPPVSLLSLNPNFRTEQKRKISLHVFGVHILVFLMSNTPASVSKIRGNLSYSHWSLRILYCLSPHSRMYPYPPAFMDVMMWFTASLQSKCNLPLSSEPHCQEPDRVRSSQSVMQRTRFWMTYRCCNNVWSSEGEEYNFEKDVRTWHTSGFEAGRKPKCPGAPL